MSEDEDQFQNTLPSFSKLFGDQDSTNDKPKIDNASESFSSHYEFLGDIAEGGIKKIQRMRDCKTGREISMAFLREEQRSSVNNERLLREARIQASLQHANIAPIYEIEYDDEGRLYFTMMLLSGETLGSILKNIKKNDTSYLKKYPLRKRLDIFLQTCDAVSYAHSRGIIHHDLKPENIQITDYNEVYVLDWGMARIGNDKRDTLFAENDLVTHTPLSSDITLLGSVNGTPGYMSPEQMSGDRNQTDNRSDIYALGAILNNIIYLDHTHKGSSVDEIISAVKEGKAIDFPDKSENTPVPISLIAIAKKAMQHDAMNRYDSVSDLKNDITRYLNDYATAAEDISLGKLFYLFSKRNWRQIAYASAAIAIISTITYFSYKEIRKQEELAEYKSQATLYEVINGAIREENKLRSSRQYKQAIKNYEKLIKLGYSHPLLHYNHARLLAGQFDLKNALYYFKKVEPSKSLLEDQKQYEQYLKQTEEFLKKNKQEELSPIDMTKYALAVEKHDDFSLRDQITWNINTSTKTSLNEKAETARTILTMRNNLRGKKLNFSYEVKGNELSIDLSNNRKLNVNALLGLPIRELNISNSEININSIFEHLKTCLRKIDISNNTIVFIDPFIHESIYETIIAKNSIFAARTYTRAPKLKHLDLEGASIGNIPNIPSASIEYLNIAYSNFKSYEVLKKFTSLKKLVIDQSQKLPKEVLDILKKNRVKIQIK